MAFRIEIGAQTMGPWSEEVGAVTGALLDSSDSTLGAYEMVDIYQWFGLLSPTICKIVQFFSIFEQCFGQTFVSIFVIRLSC